MSQNDSVNALGEATFGAFGGSMKGLAPRT